ncbi:hypothetical protein V6N13_049576 [Hibiscus sabdariffa]|uniref:Pentatricopeptide repeat-containing protein n=1 Tax=Hibiscus sabdariffa TaxID=183260 RepID=A0ABR2QWT1_9ROSI
MISLLLLPFLPLRRLLQYFMANQDVRVDNALTNINMHAKCGSIAYLYNVFNWMPLHNLVSWNAIIAAFGNHGLGRRTLEHFEPDCVTFVGLLMACNHGGMVDEGLVFDCMQETYCIAPDIEHFSCLTDMLGDMRRSIHIWGRCLYGVRGMRFD